MKVKRLWSQEYIDAKQMGPFLFKFNLESETTLRTYFIRILWELEGAAGFNFNGRSGRRYTLHSAVTSLPMFAKYARINFSDIPMKKLLIKLKDPLNLVHAKLIKDDLTQNLDQQGLHNMYEIFLFTEEQVESKKVSH